MSPIYAARIARFAAEKAWRDADRDNSITMEQRTAARKAYEQAKANYLAVFKLARAEQLAAQGAGKG